MLHPAILQQLNDEHIKDMRRNATRHKLAQSVQASKRKSMMSILKNVSLFAKKISKADPYRKASSESSGKRLIRFNLYLLRLFPGKGDTYDNIQA